MRFVDTGLDGPDESLERWLLPLLPNATVVAAQSGFFSLPGWNLLAHELHALLERGGQLHLVVGGRPEQTDPKGLQAALDLTSQYPDTTSLIAVDDIAVMHTAKAYYVQSAGGDEYSWVGSANLTGRGMQVNYQAGIQLGPEDDPKHAQRVLESVTAWRDSQRPGIRVDQRYIRELWPAARAGIFNSPPKQPRRILNSIERALDAIEANNAEAGPTGLPTGLTDLDNLLYGLHPGELIIVGGAEAMGKTTLLLNFVRATCQTGVTAGYLTLQTTVDEITFKLLSASTAVPAHHLRGGYMTDPGWGSLANGMGPVSELPIYLASHPVLTLDQLLLQIEDLASNGAQLVAIDMAVQVTVPGCENREQELTLISSRLKAIALQLEITVVAAWSLGRGPHQRADKRPLLQDLWGSSQCARDADVVILVHREEAYDPLCMPGEAELLVAKHRNGSPGVVGAVFQPRFSRFVDLPSD